MLFEVWKERFKEWLTVRFASLDTVHNYLSGLAPFYGFVRELGLSSWTEVTRDVLEEYRNRLFYSKHPKTGRALSVGTHVGRLMAVKTFFRFLAREGFLLADPAVHLELPRQKKPLPAVLSEVEVVRLMEVPAALVAILTSVAFYSGPDTTRRVAPGAIWLAEAFSSVLALGRTWQREREDGALLALLVSPLPRAAIFLGKALGIFVFVSVILAIVVPIVALLFHVDLAQVGPLLVVALLLGTVGVAATGTLFGVMTVRTRARDLVFATVLFPLLSPALICGVAATREIFAGAVLADVTDYFVLLAVFDLVSLGMGLLLFPALVED